MASDHYVYAEFQQIHAYGREFVQKPRGEKHF